MADREGRKPLPFSFFDLMEREGPWPVPKPAGCEALILDLDGVLADTEPMHQKAWDVALDGIPLEKLAAVRSKWVGMASVDIVQELIRVFGLTVPAEELLARKRAAYRELIRVPGDLVAYPKDYIHRSLLEDALRQALVAEERDRIVTLSGRGGLGKTSLRAPGPPRLEPDQPFEVACWFSARDIDLLVDGPQQVTPDVLTDTDIAKNFAICANRPPAETKDSTQSRSLKLVLAETKQTDTAPFCLYSTTSRPCKTRRPCSCGCTSLFAIRTRC